MAMMHAQAMAHRAMSSKDVRNGTSAGPRNSSRFLRAALNRIIVASHNEVVALRAADRTAFGGAATRLSEQTRRRLVFQRDVGAIITRLGGTPAKNASLAARVGVTARRLHALLMGPHQGDAYAACARATARTANAYWNALRAPLPSDVRARLEQQYSEVERDGQALRRLRWGAGPSFAH
jgi:hypothetical protein